MALAIVKPRGLDLVGGEEEALESIVRPRGLDLVGGEEEAFESKETRTGINPNPNPNKRAKEEEETQTVRSENKKLKEEKASLSSADDTQAPNRDLYPNRPPNYYDPNYFDDPDLDPDDTRPILKKYQNLHRDLENLNIELEGEDVEEYDSSSAHKEILVKRVPVNRSVVCDICKATGHEAPACYCWWEIPPGVKIDEEKYDIVCHCGMALKDGKCSRGEACLHPTASHIMSKEYRLAVMKNFNIEDYIIKKPYKVK